MGACTWGYQQKDLWIESDFVHIPSFVIRYMVKFCSIQIFIITIIIYTFVYMRNNFLYENKKINVYD